MNPGTRTARMAAVFFALLASLLALGTCFQFVEGHTRQALVQLGILLVLIALSWFLARVKAQPPLGFELGLDDLDGMEAEDPLWDAVCTARTKYLEQHLGPLPADILKIGHLIGVWPGGGLYQIAADRIAHGMLAYISFGLSNPDMPASSTVTDVEQVHDELGRVQSSSSRLSRREPTLRRAAVAGYGYELVVYTKEDAQWPLWLLQWGVGAELLHDADFLGRMDRHGGMTVERVRIGEDEYAHILIAPARPPLPTGTDLPNGRMVLVMATLITEEEMQWSQTHGRQALIDRLQQAGAGQISTRGRATVHTLRG